MRRAGTIWYTGERGRNSWFRHYSRIHFTATARLPVMETSVERLQMNLAAVKQSLENLFLRAPASGQLSLLDAEIGQQKSQGQRLGQVDILDGYKVRAYIDEYYISRVNQGQTATCELTGQTYQLVLKKVYPEVRNGQFEVDLEFTGEVPQDIRRGQTLQIKLALGDLTEAILLARGGFYQINRWELGLCGRSLGEGRSPQTDPHRPSEY